MRVQPMPNNQTAQSNGNTLEEVLLRQGVLTADQVSSLKLESINTGQPTEKIIVERSLVPVDKLTAARAEVLNFPFIKLEGKGIRADVLSLVPEPVALRYQLIPFDRQSDQLLVAMVDPLDLQVIQFVEKKSGLRVKPYLGVAEDILKAINEQYSQSLTSDVTSAMREVTQISPKKLEDEAPTIIREAPVANIVNQLLEYAVKTRASDIHIEPLEEKTRVRFRIDGILYEKIILPKAIHDALISRIKGIMN